MVTEARHPLDGPTKVDPVGNTAAAKTSLVLVFVCRCFILNGPTNL